MLLLLQDHTLALLKAIGISEGGRGGSRRGGGRLGRRQSREAHFSDDGSLSGSTPEAAHPPGSLGAKLQELGKRLLQVSRLWEGSAREQSHGQRCSLWQFAQV